MKKTTIIILILLAYIWGYAEEKQSQDSLKIKGKPIVQLFTNFKAGLYEQNKSSGFNIDRAFIGYEVALPKGFSAMGRFNMGTTRVGNELKFEVFVKNIQVNWEYKNFFTSVGLINLMQFSEPERFWGHRYIFKSFQEQYGYTFCEDIGILAGYHFTKWLSVDVAFTNGEGRKFQYQNNEFRYGAGISFKPIKGLLIRGYFDYYEDTMQQEENEDQLSYSVFVGYQHPWFTLGAEYDQSYNFQFAKGLDLYGCSFFGTVKVYKNFYLYGRFDLLKSNKKEAPRDEDGNMIIAGFEYKPWKYLSISPNYQTWKGENSIREHYLLISLGFSI